MEGWWGVVLVLIASFSTVLVWAVVTEMQRRGELKRVRDAALKVHRSRMRKVYGCLHCGIELLPNDFRYLCGTCREEYSYCRPCYERAQRNEGKFPRHEHRMFLERINWEIDPSAIGKAPTCAKAFDECFRVYAARNCLGWRPTVVTEEGKNVLADEYSWLSYDQTRSRAVCFAEGLMALGVKPRDMVVLFAPPSVEWYLTHYACMLTGFVVVPVHSSTSIPSLAHVLTRCNPACIVASRHLRVPVDSAHLASSAHVPIIVYIADCADATAMRNDREEPQETETATPISRKGKEKEVDATERKAQPDIKEKEKTEEGKDGKEKGIEEIHTSKEARVMQFEDVLEYGQETATRGARYKLPELSPDDIVMLLPTSGTSGLPKLTIVTESMVRHQARPPDFAVETVMLSFEPLRQSLDVLAKGGEIGVYSGSMDRLLDDIQVLRPTIFGATPAFWVGLHQEYLTALSREVQDAPEGVSALKVEAGLLARWKERNLLGNRCKLIIVGGAATTPGLRDWLFSAMQCIVIDGYGTTETGGLSSNQEPRAGTNLQLIDCPELGYLTSDQPHPRGEIVARTIRMTPGYYGDPEATAERFVTLGGLQFFRTGDIGEMVDGQLNVIDRRNSVFKLAQGVFIAPTPLEQLYGSSDLVAHVFIYGRASMHSVAAAVVPSSLLKERGEDGESILRKEFRRHGRSAGKPAWEIPQTIVIDEQEWTPENGLLSTIGKPSRPALIKHYEPMIQRLLSLSDSATMLTDGIEQNDDKADKGSQLSMGLRRLLLDTLPSIPSPSSLEPSATLADLGADSMALARLAAAIKDRFGVTILLPQMVKLPSLLHLQLYIFSGGTAGMGDMMNQVVVPNTNEDEIQGPTVFRQASDWWAEVDSIWGPLERSLECIVERKESSADMEGEKEEEAADGHILLTGATGFFGAFLLREMLHHSAWCGRRVVCIARGKDEAEATQRVKDNLYYYGLWEEGFVRRLSVLPGDLSEPRFGLSEEIYADMTKGSRIVIHNAAVVNSVLPYAALRGSNVIATANMLELVAQANAVLHHVSTIGLLSGSGVQKELEDVPPVALSLLSGYAQSKWVAEQLVLRATHRFGLSSCIYRPGTLSGHSLTGACNPQDTTTRFLIGLSREGIYCADEDSPLPRTFPVIPTDWAATAVVRIAGSNVWATIKPPIFHIVNRNPLSLEDLIEGIQAAGTPMRAIESEAFRERMSTLSLDHPLYVFRSVLSSGGYASGSAKTMAYDKNTKAAIKALGSPVAASCPHFTREMIVRLLEFSRQHATEKSN